MKERPILFSAPMVRALLDDTKTQTRRLVKPQPVAGQGMVNAAYCGHPHLWLRDGSCDQDDPAKEWRCPYGQPGDRLWVREAFSGPWCMEAQDGIAAAPPSKWGESSRIWYWADGEPAYGDWTRPRPSIHMPRWASRITLEVTGVRVERLQDISEADAQAEGIFPHVRGGWHWLKHDSSNPEDWNQLGYKTAALAFQALWESINGPESWAANPWVWAVEFKRVEQGQKS